MNGGPALFSRECILVAGMSQDDVQRWGHGDVIALRYVSTDQRIEMCWPSRVVTDSEELLVLFICAGSQYAAGPKRSAVEKCQIRRDFLPPDHYEWRKDTLRILLPGRCHSVWLFWEGKAADRRFEKYFINMEEPFRRTATGIDTQDHTLDIVVNPDLQWAWRDEKELDEHVRHGFYTHDLAKAIRTEGERAIGEITNGTHPCLNDWDRWLPDPDWQTPALPADWEATSLTFWERRTWAYGDDS